MSITRRAFIRTSLGVAGAALASCSRPALSDLNGRAPVVITTPTLTIWTTSYAIDDAVARWRGAHPRIPVTRKVIAATQLDQWIATSIRGERSPPDMVITDSTTIASWNVQRFWRQLQIPQTTDAQHVQIGRQQTTDAMQSRFAIALAVNPLGVWYARDSLRSVVPQPDPLQVTAAFGATLQSFVAFLTTVAPSLPNGPLLSSILDDLLLPELERRCMGGDAMDSAWEQSMMDVALTAQNQRWAAPERHFSGAWYQRITHEHTAMMLAGRWMQAALMRAVNESPSTWRLCAPAGGFIAGPSLVAAVPEASSQPESAIALLTDLANDADLQHLLCIASGTVPSLRAAHAIAPFVGSDPFCGGQQIGTTWCEAAESLATVPQTADRIARRRELQERLIKTITR